MKISMEGLSPPAAASRFLKESVDSGHPKAIAPAVMLAPLITLIYIKALLRAKAKARGQLLLLLVKEEKVAKPAVKAREKKGLLHKAPNPRLSPRVEAPEVKEKLENVHRHRRRNHDVKQVLLHPEEKMQNYVQPGKRGIAREAMNVITGIPHLADSLRRENALKETSAHSNIHKLFQPKRSRLNQKQKLSQKLQKLKLKQKLQSRRSVQSPRHC